LDFAPCFDFDALHESITVTAGLNENDSFVSTQALAVLSDRNAACEHNPVAIDIRRPYTNLISRQIDGGRVEPLKYLRMCRDRRKCKQATEPNQACGHDAEIDAQRIFF
jgi:hypothetical protein